MKLVDIIVPCFNEEEVLSVFVEETNKVLEGIPDYRFRYIFIDDGSEIGHDCCAAYRVKRRGDSVLREKFPGCFFGFPTV